MIVSFGLDPTRALVISQIVLSFGIPQAQISPPWLNGRRDVLGGSRNRIVVSVPLCSLVGRITTLNLVLLVRVFGL